MLVERHMLQMEQPKRDRLSDLIGRLYNMRIVADYQPSIKVDGQDAREAIPIMTKVFEAF